MLVVLGELVVDLIPVPGADAGPEGTAPTYVARPGGNALNVAVAAGRLGTPVRLMARLGAGPLAINLRRHAELSGVDPDGFIEADEPVSLAVVGLSPDGSADYGFHVHGAADWQWTDDELARVLPERTAILHVGSISSWTAPGSEAIARLVERLAAEGSALISVDPNIRPMLADGPIGASLGNTADIVRDRLDRLIRHADVVKVSAEDLTWLEPRTTDPAALDAAARQWAERGPALVLVTDGGAPLRIARPGHDVLHRRTPRVTVVDTVGAGDSLAAGLLTGLLDAGITDRAALESVAEEELLRLVDDAATGRRPELHARRRRPAHACRAGRRPRRPMTVAVDTVGIVSFAEVSATAVRARLLEAHDRFWDTDTRELHHPVWFHQFGGFGALARTAGGEDVGYLLGVVTADRLAYLHLLAVRADQRRSGLGRRLCAWFDALAGSTGARVVQAVTRPDDAAATAFHTALGASTHLSRDHAGPGEDRLVLTRSLPRG